MLTRGDVRSPCRGVSGRRGGRSLRRFLLASFAGARLLLRELAVEVFDAAELVDRDFFGSR